MPNQMGQISGMGSNNWMPVDTLPMSQMGMGMGKGMDMGMGMGSYEMMNQQQQNMGMTRSMPQQNMNMGGIDNFQQQQQQLSSNMNMSGGQQPSIHQSPFGGAFVDMSEQHQKSKALPSIKDNYSCGCKLRESHNGQGRVLTVARLSKGGSAAQVSTTAPSPKP